MMNPKGFALDQLSKVSLGTTAQEIFKKACAEKIYQESEIVPQKRHVCSKNLRIS